MFKLAQVVLLVALTLSMVGCKSCRDKDTEIKIPQENTGPSIGGPLSPIDPETGDPDPRAPRGPQIPETDVKTVYFAYDRFEIRPDQIPDLEKSAKFIKKQSRTILIEGHCDERGTIEYNMALGQKRAEAVKTFLVSRGVDEAKLTTISRGKEMPAIPGDDEAARTKNRRCEFYYNSK